MPTRTASSRPKRVLLSGVFGPFGVDDAFGRKENIMELFHNQVTREQGVASFRFMHRSFGLYFIAANIDADVTVLDFPSRDRFIRELKQGYDVVGISFITPNFVKAREMARLTRQHAPGATIVIGGHGAAIEGVETLIDCDHVVKGEGIRWMREFLGQDPDAPIHHPSLSSADRQSILGVPLLGTHASLLVPGLGCVNACKFCCTSHFFGRQYTSYLHTGREMFEVASRIADERGTEAFFVMDENFLKSPERAYELMAEMERHQRFFSFQIFSSAETIVAFGLDNLVRLGVNFIWMGVECRNPTANFAKNQGIDPKPLIRALRDRGIIVLASGILAMEHHTPDNIQDDIDYLVGLEADLVQFMLLTPLPTTQLYLDMKARGLLREDLPFEEWHGQKHLSYRNPHFPGDSAERWLRAAFRQDYETNGSSMYRVTETAVRGYRYFAGLPNRDGCLEHRFRQARATARRYSYMLPTVERYAVNAQERARAEALDREASAVMGRPSPLERLVRFGARLFADRWNRRVRQSGDGIQPRTRVTHYRAKSPGAGLSPGLSGRADSSGAGSRPASNGVAARVMVKEA